MGRTYTVEDISTMLQVDAETVRRWCRDGKLIAKIDSKKKGYSVKHEDLKEFMYDHTKYWFRFRDYILLNG